MMPSFDRCVRTLACFLLLSLHGLQFACNAPHDSSLHGYISREDDRWLQKVIPVCFEQAQGYEKDRTLIREIVSSEYARADIYLEGWAICGADDSGIRIRFDENADLSQTHDMGRKNAGVAPNLTLGFKSRCGGIFSGTACESNIALHEFGHALGLHHEMNRRDNQDCVLDQMAGEGEDALQIGSYDKNSIMDYCSLYAANDRGEALRLSAQDVAALKALYSGLVASLDRLPPMLIQSPWSAYIKGSALSTYRYAWGPKKSLACDQWSSYSESQSLDQPIEITPSKLHADPSTVWTLCLLGENAEGHTQDLKAYSSIDFRIMDRAEISSIPTVPTLVEQPFLYRQDKSPTLEIQVAGLPLRSLFASLSYSQSSIYKPINNARFESRDLGRGRYQLIFKPEDFPSNGEVYVSTLELTDILGQKLYLFSSGAGTPFFGENWTSPPLFIDWSFHNDEKGPDIQQIQAFPQELSAGHKASFFMEIQENSRLQSMHLVLASEHGSLEPLLTWQRLGDRLYRIDLDIPSYAVNGRYQWVRLDLEDIMNNRSSYGADPSSHVIQGTTIPLPALILNGGLPYENNPPQLRGLRFSQHRLSPHDKAFVELDIVDESLIKEVRLSLRHRTDQGFYRTIYGIDRGEISGKRRIALNVTKEHPPGEWVIQEITIVDQFGHSTRYKSNLDNWGTIELFDSAI